MSLERPLILNQVIQVLETMTQDWDMDYTGAINEDVKLVEDLTFASIDIIQLVVALEEAFQRRDLPVDRLLLKDGRYVDEIKVSSIVDFLKAHL